jgi:hypothetical protein
MMKHGWLGGVALGTPSVVAKWVSVGGVISFHFQLVFGRNCRSAAITPGVWVPCQLLGKLRSFGRSRDFLVLNFGLHFSETYREELEQLVAQVGYTLRAIACFCLSKLFMYLMSCACFLNAMQ